MGQSKNSCPRFREFDRRVFEKSLEWLNDPEIKYLIVAPDSDRESRERWFNSLKTNKSQYIKSIWCKEEPIGAFGIKHITPVDGEVWGYIGEKKHWDKTLGKQMFQYLVDYARSNKMTSLYARLLKDNIRSYNLFLKIGFVFEKDIGENMILMRLIL